MKRFFQHIVFFILALVIAGVIVSAANFHLIKKNILCPNSFFLGDSTRILLIGDSHVGLSLNPEYIQNSNNQFVIGEHYLYTACRLKYFLENNPQLETVVLGFSYGNLAKKTDNGLFNDNKKSFYFARDFMLLGREELNLLYANDLIYFRNFLGWKLGFPTKDNLPVIIRSSFQGFDKKTLPFRSSFIDKGNHRVPHDNTKERLDEYFGLNLEPETSSLQLKYLYRIIELCEHHHVRLILYTSPLSARYYQAMPDYYKTEFDKVSNDLSSRAILKNYATYALPDSCFDDANHLNGIGAERISREFGKDLLISDIK